MDPFALTARALREPWCLWTCHMAHYGWEHALANAIALAVPALLAHPKDRRPLLSATLLMTPLLGLLLLPKLGPGQFRGASGLACLAWSWVGLRLAARKESFSVGLALLGGLGLKLALEGALGTSFMPTHPDWQNLPSAHIWGTLLGLASALPGLPRSRAVTPRRA